MVTAASHIASFAAAMRDASLTPAQRHLAYRALVDTVAVSIAGRNEEAPRIARRHLKDSEGTGSSTSWTDGGRLPAESAAWFNGTAAHVLDYDDVMTPMRGHISVALVPALVALAQTSGADGQRFSNAYVAGFEVLARLSRVIALAHYSKGWHSTSALGVLGAAVACSVLLELDERQTVHALGIAVAQAAGSRENFGTMTKSFQAGHCGFAAVRSALLAKSGFTASDTALDGKSGYLALYADKEDVHEALAALGRPPLELDATGIDVKKYACCYANHRALDALLGLRAAHGFAADDIAAIDVLTSARGLEALITHLPENGLQGKFSMHYAMAAAVLDGGVALASFDDAMVARPRIRELMAKVRIAESAGAVLPRWSAVKVTLADARAFERRVAIARGDAGDPLSDDELIRKAEDCFAYGQHAGDARAFAARAFAMTPVRVDDVIRSLHEPGAA